MLARISARQRLAYLAIALLLLFGASFSGARYLQPSASVKLNPVEDPTPPSKSVESGATPNSVEPAGNVVVHVAGAVRTPGLVHMTSGDRVGDAIKQAGGAKPNADLDQLNLAAKLVDGTQIFVPVIESVAQVGKSKSTSAKRPKSQIDKRSTYLGGKIHADPLYQPVAPVRPPKVAVNEPKEEKATIAGSVSLNTATQSDFERLPGIGPATAKKIVDYRSQHGQFNSVDELMEVKGIGPKKMEAIRRLVRL